MSAKILRWGIMTATLVGGVIWLVSQHRAIVVLREATAGLQARLAARNVEIAGQSQAQTATDAELARLRLEIVELKFAAAMTPSRSTTALSAATAKSSEARNGSALPTSADTEANRKRIAQYHRRYDPFFAQRGLTPGQVDRIVSLFILQDDAREDLQASVQEVGLRGAAPGVEDLRAKLYGPILRELQDIMGDDGYAAYIRFQKTSYYRAGFVDRILPDFTSAAAVLSSEQVDRLVSLVAANDRPQQVDPTSIASKSQIDWNAVTKESRVFLTPAQQAALQAYVILHP